MMDGAGPALGLSIGSTNLAAVTADEAITRKPVLTLYRHRAPEIGIPAENPNLDEPGLVITDFVGRAGGSHGVVTADGSVRRSEALVADALRALAYAATGGVALPGRVAVTYPAHWKSKAVDALGAALSQVSEWSTRGRPLTLIPDAAAALFAVRADPAIPVRGTVAVCDFGGGGSSITFMDAAGEYHAMAPTVRHQDFCGDAVDQLLLTAAMGEIASTSALRAVGSLRRLRAGCRVAKEQLSVGTVATLSGEPGARGEVRITRDQLDDAIRAPLNKFVAVMDQALARNGIRDLAAVVAVGGGANMPAVTTMLSRHFQVPVVTTPRPHLTAAIGAARRAAGDASDAGVTAAAMAAPVTAAAAPATATAAGITEARPPAPDTVQAAPTGQQAGPVAALAWSAAEDARFRSADTRRHPVVAANPDAAGEAVPESEPEQTVTPKRRWYRLPAVAIVPAVLAVLFVGIAAAIGLSPDDTPAAPHPSTTPTAPAGGPAAEPPSPTPEAPPATTNPPATTEAPSTSTPSATPQAAPPAAHRAPLTPRIPPANELPPIPGINEPVPGMDRVNQILQDIESGNGLGDISQLIPRSFGH
ncbi:Hsp70 family protein [Mycobacterium parmense]|nr:Hsp70 family protein [Mycobacterium parmense]MCV7349840.1 Hsp70 family protein [Mycobacterium parmense]ORW51108.1 molecular chaperone [Mycobacterium parmense]